MGNGLYPAQYWPFLIRGSVLLPELAADQVAELENRDISLVTVGGNC